MVWALHLLQSYTKRIGKQMSIEISGFAVSRCRAEPECHSSSSSFSSLAHSHPCVCSSMAKASAFHCSLTSSHVALHPLFLLHSPPLYVVTSVFFLIIRNTVTLAEITLIIIFLKKNASLKLQTNVLWDISDKVNTDIFSKFLFFGKKFKKHQNKMYKSIHVYLGGVHSQTHFRKKKKKKL